MPDEQSVAVGHSRLIVSLILFNIVSGTAAGILQMAIPVYALHLHAATAEIGLLRSASGIGMLLAVLPAGYWTDRFGWKRVFSLGTAVSAGTVFLLPFTGSILFLTLIMGLQGASNAVRMSSLSAAFLHVLNRIGLDKAGWNKGSVSIGLTFAGPLLGGILPGLLDYPLLFGLTGLLTLVPILFAVIAPGEEETAANGESGAQGILQVCVKTLSGYLGMIRQTAVLRTVLIESLSTACFAAFAAFVAVFLNRSHGMPPARASWYLIMEGSVFIVTVFWGGRLNGRYGFKPLYGTGFGISCTGLMLFGLSGSPWGLATGTVMMGAGLGLINLITYSQAAVLPFKKGQLSGLMAFCTGLGSAWGPAAAGGIGEMGGLNLIFLGFIPLFGLAFAALFIPDKTMSSEPTGYPEALP